MALDLNRGLGEGAIVRHVPTDMLWIVTWSAMRCALVPRSHLGPLEVHYIDLDETEFGPDQEWEIIRKAPVLNA